MTFQRMAGEQGRDFEDLCVQILEQSGFTVTDRKAIRFDVDIDIIAKTKIGTECWFECKGSYMDGRPGLLRTDTMKKAIANGWLTFNSDRPPYIVLTSNMPKNSGLRWLTRALHAGLFTDVICVYDVPEKKRLLDWATGQPTQKTLLSR